MDKYLILNKIKEYYKFNSDAEFARFLGITPQNLKQWYTRNTFDVHVLATKCSDINAEWLLIGTGDMLKESIKDIKNFSELSEKDTVTISKDFYEILLSQKDTIKMLQETINSQQKTITTLTAFQKRVAHEEEPVECAIAQ